MRYRRATPADIPAIARLFTAAFRESVLHVCGGLPAPEAMQDVFALVYEAEPEAAFVAEADGYGVAGYVFAPAYLSNIWKQAILRGHIWRWLVKWLRGDYGIGLYPVKVLIRDKWAFLRSAWNREGAAEARILSIAVDERVQGQGVGTELMRLALDYFMSKGVPRIRLEVRPGNAPAKRVYEKLGFVPYGYTRDSQGDWLIMFKEMER